jgi:endonuclease/exonuclease/phosphatase family metal-dependent hydrolase
MPGHRARTKRFGGRSAEPEMIRLASYNIHKCVGMDRRRRPERIVAVLKALNADIVALQEVDLRLGARPAALSAALIADHTDLSPLPFALGPQSLGWHGQTILVRRSLDVSAIRRLVLPGLEPRGAILAEVETEAGPIRVVGAHLGLIRRYRLMQFAAIRAALSHRTPMPTAILGDFNDWSRRGSGVALGPEFRMHTPGASFPAPRPMGALDRIAISGGLHLKDAGVHATPPAAIASDHLPIWAELRIGTD